MTWPWRAWPTIQRSIQPALSSFDTERTARRRYCNSTIYHTARSPGKPHAIVEKRRRGSRNVVAAWVQCAFHHSPFSRTPRIQYSFHMTLISALYCHMRRLTSRTFAILFLVDSFLSRSPKMSKYIAIRSLHYESKIHRALRYDR
jgi:hypothetical protein